MNTTALLEDLGHEVIEAPSGRQALDVLNSGAAVDVVVTDQAMPGMTGVLLAAAIQERWPTLPVILATGYAEFPPDADLTLPKLSKPFQQHALAQAITDALRTAEEARRVVPSAPGTAEVLCSLGQAVPHTILLVYGEVGSLYAVEGPGHHGLRVRPP
jgi:CheY-like chemotaxis protein